MAKRRRAVYMYFFSKHALVIGLCLVALMALVPLRPSGRVNLQRTLAGAPGPDARQLLQRVAKALDAPPIDARIDSVWQLIPELNGIHLNVQATLRNWDGLATRMAFEQVAPKTTMADLVAAPIYRGNPAKRAMALMFNVAWGTEYVSRILQILREYHVQGTFFLDGSWTKRNPVVARAIVAAGMEVGSHAYNHPMMSKLTREQMISQLTRTNGAITAATGRPVTLFAPPAGDFNNMVVRVAAGMKMKTVLWTLDTIDWRRPAPSVIMRRIVSRKTPGALVLMHPTAPTVAALPGMIRQLQQAGYHLVTVSQLLSPVRPAPATLRDALAAAGLSRDLASGIVKQDRQVRQIGIPATT